MRPNLTDKIIKTLKDDTILILSDKIKKAELVLNTDWVDADAFLDWKDVVKEVAVLNSTVLLNSLYEKGIRFKESWFPHFWDWTPTPEFALEMFSKDDVSLSKAYWSKTYARLIANKVPVFSKAEFDIAEFLEELCPSAGNLGSVGIKQLALNALKHPEFVSSKYFSFSEKEKAEIFKQFFEGMKIKMDKNFYAYFKKDSFVDIYSGPHPILDRNVLNFVSDYFPTPDSRIEVYKKCSFSPMGMALLLKDVQVFEKLLPTFKLKDLNNFDRKFVGHVAGSKVHGALTVEIGFVNLLFFKLYQLNFSDDNKNKDNYQNIENTLLKLKEVDPLFHIALKLIGKENGRPEDMFVFLNNQSGISDETKKEFFDFFKKLYTESHLIKNLKNVKVEAPVSLPSRSNRF